MSIEEMRLRELADVGMPDYREMFPDAQRLHLKTLRELTADAAFSGMFGYDECVDALLRAAMMRGIERGRATDGRWDDGEWLDDEVKLSRVAA